jgi:hypothetical protein
MHNFTLKLDFRIRVIFSSRGHCSLCPLVVVIAVDFVPIFVNEWGISTYNISIESGVFDFLDAVSVHVPKTMSSLEDMGAPFYMLVDLLAELIALREQILTSSSTCSLDS